MLDLLPYISPIHHNYYKTLAVNMPTRSSTSNAGEYSSDGDINYDP